jgi:hypothetical protein
MRAVPSPDPLAAGCTAADAFALLWTTLADVIGPTATAALMQRSVKRAAADEPELMDLVIVREQFSYTYHVPRSWTARTPAPPAALARVGRELWPLLMELTGLVVVRRLEKEPLLRRCGVIPGDVEQ